MEHKTSREKAWVASKKRNNNVIVNDGSNNEINNLQDDSFIELEELEEEPTPLTEEEKLEIRRKIGILLVFVFIAFLIMVIILIFDPFAPKKKKKEEKKEDTPVEVKEITLYDYEDGDISLSDRYITSIYNEISFNLIDYYEYNTFFLYRNNITTLNKLTDMEKTVLVSKSNDFTSLISKISTSANICEENISVDLEEIISIARNKYGTTITPVKAFKYNYYYNTSYITSIIFTLEDDKYVGKCYVHGTKITKMLEQELVSASKDKDNLYLDVKVAFITSKGVYQDPNLKVLITNKKNAKSEDYMKKAHTYRYNYVVNKDGYYLNNVSLLK